MSSNTQKRIYGIDLGTTFSAIAFINEYGKAEIITNSDNERVTPSVAFFESEGEVIVGKIAKESAKAEPDKEVSFVKRHMSDPNWTFSVYDKEYKPEEISAQILKRLVDDAKKTGEHVVEDVVITCPAYFGDLERERTRTAGKLAGLNVIEILDEPVAAAINYGLNEDAKGKNVIVYDLGGGTFDVTIVKIGNDPSKNEIEIICTEGNHQLGGKDWDDKIIRFFVSECQKSTCNISASDPCDDSEFEYDLRINAESDKKTLSNRDKVTRKISFGGDKVLVELTRQQFEEMTEELFEQTVSLTDKVIDEAKARGIDKIHTFLLVGGSTRMPQIKAKLIERYSERLGIEPVEFEVDEAVAKGAAKAGEIKLLTDMANVGVEKFDNRTKEEQRKTIEEIAEKTGKTEDEVFLAVTTKLKKIATKSYGLRALKAGQPIIRNLIVKQTPVPTSGSQIFGTSASNADEIELVVYMNNESEGDASIEVSEKLGDAVFLLEGNLPEKAPIEITFELSEQGNLTLVGLDKTHGKKITANFKTEGIMTEEEINKAKKEIASLIVS